MSDQLNSKVLFLSTGTSARSAGAEPTGKVHPMAIKVLRDAYGIDTDDS